MKRLVISSVDSRFTNKVLALQLDIYGQVSLLLHDQEGELTAQLRAVGRGCELMKCRRDNSSQLPGWQRGVLVISRLSVRSGQ